MNPVYSDAHLKAFYSQYSNNDPDNIQRWQEPLLYGHDFYLQFVEKFAQVGSMLDVGCGGGHLMNAAQKRGWNVEGYDVDPESTQKVGERLACSVYSGDFLTLPFQQKTYDLITMHQVLEHLKQPKAYLDRLHQLLKTNGVLFIAVPNVLSLSNRFKFFLEKLGLRRQRRGVYYDSDHHLLYFSPDSLKYILQDHGFEPVFLRNCHTVKPNQSKIQRWIARNITDYFFYKSAFFIIARKKS